MHLFFHNPTSLGEGLRLLLIFFDIVCCKVNKNYFFRSRTRLYLKDLSGRISSVSQRQVDDAFNVVFQMALSTVSWKILIMIFTLWINVIVCGSTSTTKDTVSSC